MSEVVVGALIGIGGAIVGAAITAIVAYVNNKSQVNLRMYELRTENLIRAREKVLVPLREAMGQSLEFANQALILMIRVQQAFKKKEDPKTVREEIGGWEKAAEKSSEALSKLEILRSQVGDMRLYHMIEEVNKSVEEENPRIIAAVLRVHEKNVDIEIVRAVARDLGESRKRIFDKLLPVNERIEELLSGE